MTGDPAEIRELLFAAWARLKGRILADPVELRRRLERRKTPALARPPRAWCIAIRACDARLQPVCLHDPHDPQCPGRWREHELRVDRAFLIRHCEPVTLQKPGELWDSVARRLGVAPRMLNMSRVNGTVRTHYVRGLLGRSMPVPILSSDRPLDPGSRSFRLQDSWWGWTCTFLPHRLPGDFEQTLTRVPLYKPLVSGRAYRYDARSEAAEPPQRPKYDRRLPKPPPDYVWYKWRGDTYIGDGPVAEARRQRRREKQREHCRRWYQRHKSPAGSLRFTGWKWKCPICGRTASMLYLPIRAREIELTKDEVRRTKDEEQTTEGDAGNSSSFIPHPSSFACGRCHRIEFVKRRSAGETWNHLISHLSGGLLYGREVPRPQWFDPTVRYRPCGPQINRAPSRRRAQITGMLLRGMTYAQIADDLGIAPATVRVHVYKIYRSHGLVRGGGAKALARKLGVCIERFDAQHQARIRYRIHPASRAA
jgi:DNA-binding CsgD family transcriptional regulator